MQQEGQNYWQAEQVEAPVEQVVAPQPSQPVTWQASEYIHHEKDFFWFAGLVLVAAALIAVSLFLVQSWTFTALVVVMVISVVVFALRPPRTLSYTLSGQSLDVNEKQYHLSEFRAFGVVQDGPLFSIVLLPVKRFMPSLTVYFPHEHGEEIVDHLGDYIPMEEINLDIIDRAVRKLRF